MILAEIAHEMHAKANKDQIPFFSPLMKTLLQSARLALLSGMLNCLISVFLLLTAWFAINLLTFSFLMNYDLTIMGLVSNLNPIPKHEPLKGVAAAV